MAQYECYLSAVDEALTHPRTNCAKCGGRLEVRGLAYPYLHVEITCLQCGEVDEVVDWEHPEDYRSR